MLNSLANDYLVRKVDGLDEALAGMIRASRREAKERKALSMRTSEEAKRDRAREKEREAAAEAAELAEKLLQGASIEEGGGEGGDGDGVGMI